MATTEELLNEVNTREIEREQSGASISKKKHPEYTLDFDVGYNLGWDAFKFGMPYNGWRANEPSCKLGYMQAKEKRIRRLVDPDRFVRKWFQIRHGAWLRNRQFNDDVTPACLRKIDQKICPVTRETLTHGLMQPTDWSIDRINNNAAYSRTNLCVMSVRANCAKKDYSFEQIKAFAYDLSKPIPHKLMQGSDIVLTPLTREEWARMLVIAAAAPAPENELEDDEIMDELVPCILPPVGGMVTNRSNCMQMTIASTAYYYRLAGRAKGIVYHFHKGSELVKSKGLTGDSKKAYSKLVSRCLKANYDLSQPFSIWKNPVLFAHFVKFYTELSRSERDSIFKLLGNYKLLGDYEPESAEKLGLENKGYNKKPAM